MKTHIYMIGGAGRIGTALAKSLVAEPLDQLGSLSIYCDLTKASGLQAALGYKGRLLVQVQSYSAFSLQSVFDQGWAQHQDRHVILLHRGINDKRYWLNQPLEAFNIQIQACRLIMESDIEMHSNVSIIHFTSQLCDLIERGCSLDEVCGGLESYRRPYMISRLHQEALLTAYAYKHSIPTTFIRLASVYGFDDDKSSPWVLNTLIRQYRKHNQLDIRNPSSLLSLMHREPLIHFLRNLLAQDNPCHSDNTIFYLSPPLLSMTLDQLASFIGGQSPLVSTSREGFATLELGGDFSGSCYDVHDHVKFLDSVLVDMLKAAS